MKRLGLCMLMTGVITLASAQVTIDYPLDGSVFPPDIAAPTFLWRDAARSSKAWLIEVKFGDGSEAIKVKSPGQPLQLGEIDQRAVSETNELPKLTPEQAAGHTWKPDTETWSAIKINSVNRPATVTITGLSDGQGSRTASDGSVTIHTSKDPVGAPIFYRDVPLMPSEQKKGFIKPLAKDAVPLIGWRLRNVSKPRSRLLLTDMYTCANCHSFSLDGKTMGMDLDGPQNHKGIYTLTSVKPQMSIRNEDVIEWSSFLGKQKGNVRLGFMSQVSPDGQHVVTMINGSVADGGTTVPHRQNKVVSGFYVSNFKDYRFLQVFYPTGGILAWYSRATGKLNNLPGADDPAYVHTNAVWSPDGKSIVFARAAAREPYAEGQMKAEYANDPKETQIQYDLYRVPFNGGKGGKPQPIAGASQNGMSNSFPKVSPDGRWIVFVQARNGQLMRPDSQLYIVPAKGGKARRMSCNTSLMNSWHSFSPNSRWLVFSSKARSPYTQMYLTHLDENGRDSPPILIENSTAANRAVNIPEFVNIPPDGLLNIDVPAVEFYRVFDRAWELSEKGQYEESIAEWREALKLGPDNARAQMNFGVALAAAGRMDEAVTQYKKSLEIDPDSAETYNNLGAAFAKAGKLAEAIAQYQKSLEIDPEYAEVHNNLAVARARIGKLDEAVASFRKAVEFRSDSAEFHHNLGLALARRGSFDEALSHFGKALEADPTYLQAHNNAGLVLAQTGKPDQAIGHFEKIIAVDTSSPEVYNNLGRALARVGRVDEAIARFQKVLELDPNSAEAHNSLGTALVWKRKPDEAIPHLERALELDPGLTEAHQNLGDILHYLKGRTPEALAHWRTVLSADPNHVLVLQTTARVLATSSDASLRNGAEAVSLAERAVQLSGGQDPIALDTLAAAYAEAGRFPEAVETARRALALATEANVAQAIKSKIALYEKETPYRAIRRR